MQAEVERAHAAQQQPGLERAEDGALVVAERADAGPELVLARGHQRAREHVAVAVQVLGGGVHDEVGAQLERPGEQRGRDRVVDRDQGTGRVGEAAQRLDVAHRPGRVRGRLEPEQAGAAGAQRGLDGGRVGGVDEIDREAPGRGGVKQPVAQPPVYHLRGDDVVAGAEGLEHGGGGGHAGGEEEGLGTALQRRQHGLGVARRRVAVAGVVEPAAVGVVRVAKEGGAGLDGRDQAAGDGIGAGRRLAVTERLGEEGIGSEQRHAGQAGRTAMRAPAFTEAS